MKIRRLWGTGASIVGMAASWMAYGQAESDLFHIERGSFYFQTGSETIVSISEIQPGAPNWKFIAGAEFQQNNLPSGNVILKGPAFPEGLIMEIHEGNPYEYNLSSGFAMRTELETAAPQGTYRFSWSNVTTEVKEEALEVPALDPLEPKKLLNYAQLQNIDPSQPTTISWEAFDDLGGKEGFLEIEAYYRWNGSMHVVWDSDDHVEQGFGLDPATTEIVMEPGTLTGSDNGEYGIYINFVRIDEIITMTTNPAGLKGVVTSTQTRAKLRTRAALPGQILLSPGQWIENDWAGWVYGYSYQWGYSFDLGWIYVSHTPGHLYQSNLGWLIPYAGTMRGGLWFYRAGYGWIWTVESNGGWYRDPAGNWSNMVHPG